MKKFRTKIITTIAACAAIIFLMVTACTPTPQNVSQSDSLPPIYPDYYDVTIPANIAPLNFLIRDDVEAVQVEAGDIVVNNRGNKVVFDEDEWHQLLAANSDITVKVTVLKDGRWTNYRSFHWQVVKDLLDPYLTYRLIEPDYEIWNRLQIKQRCIENFDEEALCDYLHADNQCMNCHATGSQNPPLSMLYVRIRYGKKLFPHLLGGSGDRYAVFEDVLRPETCVRLSEQVQSALRSRGYSERCAVQAALFTEEIGLTVLEKNRSAKRPVFMEISLLFEDGAVQLVERDTGVIFDAADPDLKVDGLSSFVLNGLLLAHRDKNNLTTMGCNRNIIRFQS